ncbi:Zn-ribbon-containing protein (plasmid) [Deinococcus sp. KNUC1210]|uniref:Zn-ribbon-containing protein n=1 Tax=Deinococcus sp. KNUC1210 TaxID=2917691 RepID=UPI001EF0B86B|nr:Zn-ribbon-containing protein [Deinococcus sp. KNUC1210]ULH18076.1 Zn-ribbon-containing protein [Deinococcus sp. KNUC1210]
MYVADLCFEGASVGDSDVISDKVNTLIAALRMNGQVCGREWPISTSNKDVVVTVLVPERSSLDESHANRYVSRALAGLGEVGVARPRVEIRGRDISSASSCICKVISSYILFTNYTSLESSLRCGSCFQPVPLYRIPASSNDEYNDIIVWQSDYQACDRLQMNCRTLERAATRELSSFDSNLSKQGIEICDRIFSSTKVPTYYYLYRYNGRSKKRERERLCPSCRKDWLLENPWHIFDFKCDSCRILSNVAWNVR